jgi:hypothetical protein
MLCDAVAIGTKARNVGASRAERAQASLGLVIGEERARRGRVERDAKGYNRFRLVIASRAVFDARPKTPSAASIAAPDTQP